ncbi:MAG: ABC transporter substrate-binding protein [Anaerolineaceae bacterium]|nr:ABC transporter substrate-binding protein [Anaerolineaceae bacterium]MDE0330080.1 ABC transporter substrate-binding protein [Anaerolineaceae bacterium]
MRRVLFLLLLLLTAGNASAQGPVTTELFLPFIPNVQFAPVYVAIENGYFAEEGLDVRIRHGAEHDGVDLVAANQLQLGIFGGEQVLLARSQGRPVLSVYEWFQQFPAGVVATIGTDYESPREFSDLAGKKVGIHGRSGVTWTAFVALMNAAGMTEQDFELETVGFNVPELVCLGLIDAAVVYLNNEPLQIDNRISARDCGDLRGYRVFPVTPVVDLVSNVIVTNETTLEASPELVKAFVKAFDRGLQAAIANPAAAMLASSPYVEGLLAPGDAEVLASLASLASLAQLAMDEADRGTMLRVEGEVDEEDLEAQLEELRATLGRGLSTSAKLQSSVLLSTIPLWVAEVLGYSDRVSWVTTAAALQAAGMLDNAPDVDLAFTNRFVPGCAAGDACP